ncbi:MAG: flavodoxin [Streptococcus sp.]|nr:flavodoxin [Streptococcus sp.]
MEHDPHRRRLIAAFAGLTLANVSLASAANGTANVQGKSRVLVAYFSRSGNTRVVAGVIHRSLNTDLFEIEPATPYPEDYFQTVDQAKNERERGVKPALKNSVADISRYETVYLGFPAPTARREKPLVIECDQERRTTETVTSWLETIRS